MRRTFANIGFLIAVNLLIKPFWIFGVDRVFQNQIGEGAYGAYFALFNFTMLFQIVNDFGIQNYNSRGLARDPGLLSAWLPNFLAAKLALSVVYFALSAAAFLALGYSLREHGPVFGLLLLNQVLISFIFYLRSNLTGLHKFRLDALFSVLDKALMIVFAGSLLYFNAFGLELTVRNFVLAQTLAFAINAALLAAVSTRLAALRSYRPDFALVGKIARESLPFALSIFLMAIYLRMDAIMIERLLGEDGPYETGLYAQSFRIIDALNMAGILFANILLPTYARQLGRGENPARLVVRAAGLMALLVTPVVLLVLFRGQAVISWLYVNDPPESGHIFTTLIFAFAAYNLMHIFSSLLTAAGRLRGLNLLFAAGIVLNFFSNLVLIPSMGARGAALTTACSEWLVLAGVAWLCWKFLRSPEVGGAPPGEPPAMEAEML